MTIATLVKITAAKKLMMKISEPAYDSITARLTAECKKKNYPTERLATFSLENDDGDDCHFVMISLDKYDRQNMRKFEVLLKKDVAFQYRLKPYDFIPDGEEEQRCGINLELISIRQMKPKREITHAILDQVEEAKMQQSENLPLLEIKKKAWEQEQSALQLKQEEKEREYEDLPLPPVLERQGRRRRTPVSTEQELSDVAKQVKKLEDLIAANELAIGADE